MCDNCNILNERIIALNNEIISMEERRSRERTRNIRSEQRAIFFNLNRPDAPSTGCDTCAQLVELITYLVRENPNMIGIHEIKSTLSSLER